MKDPERLLSGGGTADELALLRSAEADEPPRNGAVELAAALGVSAALTSAKVAAASAAAASELPAVGSASTMASAMAKGKLVAGKLALKHLAIGAGGIALAGTVAITALPHAPAVPYATAPTAQHVAAHARKAARVASSEPVVTPLAASDDPAMPMPSLPESPKPAARSPSVSEEITRLEAVRGALATNDAARALALLDAYDGAHKRGTLREEAAILRIEALSRAHRADEARRATIDFLHAYPRSVHIPRLRAGLEALRNGP